MTPDTSSFEPVSGAASPKNTRLPLVVLLVLLLLASYYFVTESEERLPSKLGDLTLMTVRSGDDARQTIDRLHGTSVTPTENLIGTYGGASGEAVLYVSVYAGSEEAASAEQKMGDRIREGNAVFGEYGELVIAGQPVAICRGMGQLHYFFASGANVFWLAVDEAAAPATIAGLVAYAGTTGYSW